MMCVILCLNINTTLEMETEGFLIGNNRIYGEKNILIKNQDFYSITGIIRKKLMWLNLVEAG